MCLTINLSFFPLRSRKRKQEEEEEFDDEDVGKNEEDDYASSEEEDLQSDDDTSDDEDEFISDEGDNRVNPGVRNRYSNFWYNIQDLSPFQSVDGDKIFRTDWNGRKRLHWDAREAIEKGERDLVSKQRKRTIKVEMFGRRKISQVPYRELLMLFYFCFFISLRFNIC